MTQIILNVENPDIIPSLRKVLGQINGVTISKTNRIVDTEKKDIRTFKEFSAEELEQLKEALKYGSLKRMMESRGYDVSVKKLMPMNIYT